MSVADWDARVATFSGVDFVHGSAWARVLRDAYGFNPQYLVRREGETWLGVLPLMHVESRLTGRRGVSLPFTDACPILARDPEVERQLVADLAAHSRAEGWRYHELRCRPSAWPQTQASVSYFGHRLELNRDPTVNFARFESAHRRAIRKAQNAGLQCTCSTDLDELKAFYGLFCLTRRKHGAPPQPWPFFLRLHQHLLAPGGGLVVVARLGRKPVAAAVYLHGARDATYRFGGSDPEANELRGNNLVMWAAIEHYGRAGLSTLDFGRTSLSNDGLRRFKLGWGTAESEIDYFRFEPQRDAPVRVPDLASGWQARVFQKLPVPVSRILGRLLYRHIA